MTTTIYVCAACGARVLNRMHDEAPTMIAHEPGCPRDGWPVWDATQYDDGKHATTDEWVKRD